MINDKRTLNRNEIFCCSKKDVKNFFGNCDIIINFASYHRNYQINSLRKKKNKNIKGKIIASLSIFNTLGQIGSNGSHNIYLYFYVLKKEKYSEELEKIFISQYLSKLKDFYNKYKDFDKINGEFEAVIELKYNELIWHENVYT